MACHLLLFLRSAGALHSRTLRGTARGGRGVQGVPRACPDKHQTLIDDVPRGATGFTATGFTMSE
jgi:hypothetical protein